MASARIPLRVQASARRNEFVGIRDGVLVVRVTAPAIEGRANDLLRRMVAKRLRVPVATVRIARGHRSRDKVIEVDGFQRGALIDALAE